MDGTGVVSRAGTVLLSELADRIGLTAALSEATDGLRERRGGPDPGRVLVDVAVAIADGAVSISDVQTLADQQGLHGRAGSVASTPTTWRVLAGIDAAMLTGIRRARALARDRAWLARGELTGAELPGSRAAGKTVDAVVIDLDARLHRGPVPVRVFGGSGEADGITAGGARVCSSGASVREQHGRCLHGVPRARAPHGGTVVFEKLKQWWRARRRTAAEPPSAPPTLRAPRPALEQGTAVVVDGGSKAPAAEQALPPRNMAGTPLHLYFEHLAPDQQTWFLERERDWLDRVDLPRQDFHLVPGPADGGQGWEVRLGSPTGPLLPVACPFAVGPWNLRNKVLPWRLVHLFMDRNEIEGQLVVLRKGGQWHETETVRQP